VSLDILDASAAAFLIVSPLSLSVPGIVLSRMNPVIPEMNIPVLNKICKRESKSGDPVVIASGFAFAH